MAEAERWATFDCYGTLIDWNTGIRGELARLFGEGRADALLARYHELEPQVQREAPDRSYRDVLALTLARLASEEGLELADEDRDALGRSLPAWPPFPEAHGALAEARGRGWRLGILSNTDRELLEASLTRLAVPADAIVVAGEIGSYKPAHRHWERFFAGSGADRARHVHVAQSHFHDIVPATELGLRTVWVNRLGERREPPATRELSDLHGLADTLDDLVPA
jgi:2-haloacid dehalogenase